VEKGEMGIFVPEFPSL